MNEKDTILKSYKILVVEDEDKIREYVVKSLRYIVDDVKEAANGQEALEVLESFSPDIIITDIEMPIMNGVDLIKNVRKTNQDVAIVVLTAYDDKEYLYNLINMHLEHYIIKPINFDKLLNVLYNCQEKIEKNTNINLELKSGYMYNFKQKTLTFEGECIKLTKKEIAFLELLFQHRDRVVHYEEFQQFVWKEDVMTEGAIKSLLKHLRKKLPKNIISNLSGVGYKLEDN